MTKSAKIATIALIGMFTVLSASNQRIAALGGNAGFWPGDDANIALFPATINDFNIAQVSGIDNAGAHNAYVLWGEGTKYGFSWEESEDNNSMINLMWGNGSMGLDFGLSSVATDNGQASPADVTTSGMGLDIGFGMNMDFGELGVGFSTKSYDDGNALTTDDASAMTLRADVRRGQDLWLFDQMLIGFSYASNNADWSALSPSGAPESQTTMKLGVDCFTHLNIAEGTTGLVAMGFGFESIGNVDLTEDATSTTISFPDFTFAVESSMTDWATVRVGVTSGYNLSKTTNAGPTGTTAAPDVSFRGGNDNSKWSFGLGFNYGSFNLDLDVTEDLYTNPVQHVVGYEELGGASATMTYTW